MVYEVKVPKCFLKIKKLKSDLEKKLYITRKAVFQLDYYMCNAVFIENDIDDNVCFILDLRNLKQLVKGQTKLLKENIILKIELDENKKYGIVSLVGKDTGFIRAEKQTEYPDIGIVFDNESLDKLTPITQDFLRIREFNKSVRPEIIIRDNIMRVMLGDYKILECDYNTDYDEKKKIFKLNPETFCITFDDNEEFLFYTKFEKVFCKQGNKLFVCVAQFS